MEPWTVFKWVRRVTFSSMVIFGLIWAVLLSVYLSKAWSHSTTLQRAIILAIICVNGFSSLLLYLMVVVVFRTWKELLRMLFLLGLHVGPAVLFTMYRSRFVCAPFDIQTTCDIARFATLCVVWAITGILLMYTIYLCIMSRAPRPFPLVTPNDLLTDSNTSLSRAPSRAPSMSSVKSATGLLSQPQVQPYSLPIGRLASPSPSTPSQSSFVSRTVAKKLFVVNTDVASVSSDTATRSLRGQQLRRGVSYGAMGSPAHPRPVDRLSIPTAPSTFSGTSVATPLATAIPSTAFTRRPSVAPSVTPKQTEEGNASRAPQRSPLLGVNPFTDSPSRNPSPESFYSQLSMRSAPANLDMGNAYNPFSRTYGGYLTPYFSYSSNGSLVSIPPQLNPGKFPTGRLSNPSIPFMASSQSSLTSYPGTPFCTPALTLSNTSVHSLAPSVHFAGHHTPPDVPVDIASREPSPYAPPATYMRPGSDDPLRRAGGARPRANGGSNGMPYQGDVRRYWSMPGSQSGSHSAGAGYGAPGHRYLAAPTQPGYGYAGQVRQGPPPMVMYPARMANGVGGPKDASWREMVMRAASS